MVLFFTARSRRMREGNIFSLSTLTRGYPIPGQDRGYNIPRSRWRYNIPRSGQGNIPSQVWTEGYPIPGLDRGVLHSRSGQGFPIPGPDRGFPSRSGPRSGCGGTPTQDWMGYPPSVPDWMGVPPCPGLDGYPPCPGLDGVPPPPIQD